MQAVRAARFFKRRMDVPSIEGRAYGRVPRRKWRTEDRVRRGIYDMCKAIDREMIIEGVRLMEKSGGRSGTYFAAG
jgi:hypothetical protein